MSITTTEMNTQADLNHVCKQCRRCSQHGLDRADSNGTTALFYVVSYGHSECLRSLLSGTQIDVNKGNNSRETPLMYGAQHGHLECLRVLVYAGANVNIRDENGSTALTYASFQGHSECVRYLLENGAMTNVSNIYRLTPLIVACSQGHRESVGHLIRHGAYVNMYNSLQETPLMVVAKNDHAHVIDTLLENGADLDARDMTGDTALSLAVACGNIACVEKLVKHNADVNAKNNKECTPLIIAALNEHVDCMHVLINGGASVNVKIPDGRTPLHITSKKGNILGTEVVLEGNPCINAIDKGGNTPLIYSALGANHQCLRPLISSGADVNIQNANQDSALSVSVLNGSLECVQLLLDATADVNQIHANENSVLHLACMSSWEKHQLLNSSYSDFIPQCVNLNDDDTPDITEALIAAGACVNVKNKDETLPIIMAIRNGKVESFKFLLNQYDNYLPDSEGNTLLHHAIIHGSTECLNLIITKFENILETANNKKETPLKLALLHNRENCARYLLEAGANWSINTIRSQCDLGSLNVSVCNECEGELKSYYDHYIPLLVAATRKNHLYCMHVLLLAGCDVNQADQEGMTSLMVATSNDQLIAVNGLIESGADVDRQCQKGWTALFIAAYKENDRLANIFIENNADTKHKTNEGHLACLHVLVSAGANVNIRDENGSTALIYASFQGHWECVRYLLENGAMANVSNILRLTPLIVACNQGHGESVGHLIRNGADVNMSSSLKETPLIVAAKNDHAHVIDTLLENGADINARDRTGDTALCLAVASGSIACVEKLVERNADVNVKNNKEFTPLVIAALNERVDCMHVLINGGACVNVKIPDCRTPMHITSMKGNILGTEVILGRKPCINAIDKCGNTPLIYAAVGAHHHCVRALISSGADVNIQNANQVSALSISVLNGNLECVQLLLDATADVNQIHTNGNSVLHLACMSSCVKHQLLNSSYSDLISPCVNLNDDDTPNITEALIAAGAFVNVKNKGETLPIVMAIRNGKAESLKLLLKKYYNSLSDSEGNTFLHHAIIHGSTEFLNLIITKFQNILEIANNKKEIPLTLAHLHHRKDCARYLLEVGAKWSINTIRSQCDIGSLNVSVCNECEGELKSYYDHYIPLLVAATRKNHLYCMHVLLLAGCDVNQADQEGMTSLMVATSNDQFIAVKGLIESGADVDRQCRNGRTAIFIAAFQGNDKTTKYLIENNADIELKNNEGYSPLFAAFLDNHQECIQLLIDAGSMWDIETNKQNPEISDDSFKGCSDCTATVRGEREQNIQFSHIKRAIERGHSHCVYALLLRGQDINSRDSEGKTPLMVSMMNKFAILAKKLLENGADLNAQCKRRFTAVMYAVAKGHIKFLQIIPKGLLQTEIADIDGNTALNLAAKNGRVTCVKLLLGLGADVNTTDNKGVTPLMNGVHRKGCVQRLLAAKADVNIAAHNGQTALMNIAECWRAEGYLDILLKKFPNVNASDQDGKTALHYASSYGVVEKLMAYGVDPNLPDNNGVTPVIHLNRYLQLMAMVKHGGDPDKSVIYRNNFLSILGSRDLKIIQTIVSSGAFPQISNFGNDTETPLMMAIKKNKLDVAKYFLSINYLTTGDTKLGFDPDTRPDISTEARSLLRELHSQPWPLSKLALITISTAVGPSPGRRDRIQQLPLPPRIQRMLAFEELTSKLCVTLWEKIDLCFDRAQYERRCVPRPKLYFWPFLRKIEKLKGSECEFPCYKFAE